MKILIVDDCYNEFIRRVYADRPHLEHERYEIQRQALLGRFFAVSAFYERHLSDLGHQAHATIFNALPLGRAWLHEHGLPGPSSPDRPMQEILAAQVRYYRPDVLYILEMSRFDEPYLRALREHTRLIVGQIACPLQDRSYRGFDLVLSSLPHYVEHFRRCGTPSELFLLGFEHSILDHIDTTRRDGPPLVHVGGLGAVHAERNILLERLCRRFDLQLWGYGIETVPPNSPLRRHYRGEAWGLDMFRIMASARIVPNAHISSVAGEFANNCRLYEATGTGCLLVTDAKRNLHNQFEIDREVLAYASPGECEEKIAWCLDHPGEAAAIARAGQRRTLREHTYRHRMSQLAEILRRRL